MHMHLHVIHNYLQNYIFFHKIVLFGVLGRTPKVLTLNIFSRSAFQVNIESVRHLQGAHCCTLAAGWQLHQ